jgi:hypothetical protein
MGDPQPQDIPAAGCLVTAATPPDEVATDKDVASA